MIYGKNKNYFNLRSMLLILLTLGCCAALDNEVSAQAATIDELVFGKGGQEYQVQMPAAPSAAGDVNVVICRMQTTRGVPLSSQATAVLLDEYKVNAINPSGMYVQTIALPIAASGSNLPLTASGTALSECQITNSADGRYLLITGYGVAPGTANPAAASSATAPRVIGRIDASGNIDTTTTTTSFSGTNIRSATSSDGTNFWAVGGNTGVVYNVIGSSDAGTIVSNTQPDLRVVKIFGGQLYVSSGAGTNTNKGVNTVGTGLPMTPGQTTTRLPGLTDATISIGSSFFFADLSQSVAGLDTLYVADAAGGIQKYSFDGATWTVRSAASGGTFPDGSGTLGLAGIVSGTTVSLFVTTNDLAYFLTDSTGSTGTLTLAGQTVFVAATGVRAMRGIALAPRDPVAPTAAVVSIGGRVMTAAGRGIADVRISLTDLQGKIRMAISGSFGYYRFDEIEAGATYILAARGKRYTFSQPTQVLNVNDEMDEINFIANPSNR